MAAGAALRAEARALVESMPGPLRRIVVRSADHTVEVEWPRADPVRSDGAAPAGEPPPAAAADVPGADGTAGDAVAARFRLLLMPRGRG